MDICGILIKKEMMKLRYDSIFEKIWLLLHREYDVYTKNKAKKLVIEILDEVYHKGYNDCYEDFRTGKNLLVR